ncbi:hypothetical protein [Rhodococcus aetherivorans]
MTTETHAGLIDEFTDRDRQALFQKTVITPEDLAVWVTDGAPLPAAARKEPYRVGSEHRGDDERLAELNGVPGRDKVLAFLSDYVRDFVPAPAITEDDHWVVTLRTQAEVLSRINIGPVHVALSWMIRTITRCASAWPKAPYVPRWTVTSSGRSSAMLSNASKGRMRRNAPAARTRCPSRSTLWTRPGVSWLIPLWRRPCACTTHARPSAAPVGTRRTFPPWWMGRSPTPLSSSA